MSEGKPAPGPSAKPRQTETTKLRAEVAALRFELAEVRSDQQRTSDRLEAFEADTRRLVANLSEVLSDMSAAQMLVLDAARRGIGEPGTPPAPA